MSETPTPQTTALAIPETGPAIARIIDDVMNVAANLLPDRRGKQRLSMKARRAIIEEHLVRSPSNATAPYVAQVSFGGEMVRVGSTLAPTTTGDGSLVVDERGRTVMGFEPDYDVAITGKTELPDHRDPSKRVARNVQPLVLCDMRGGLIPYVHVEEGQLRAGAPMFCLFIRDFDLKTGQENARIRAVPLGLADPANVERYNEIARRLAAQGSAKAGQLIDPIPNNLGRTIQFLTITPAGTVGTQGRAPVWKGRDFKKLNGLEPDYWIVERLGGKAATLAHRSQPVIIRNGEVLEQVFQAKERWNSVELTVWGLPGEIGDMELHELEHGDFRVDWLTLCGASLYTVTPRSGTTLVRQALQRPPVAEMISVGLLPPGSNEELARQTIRSLGRKIVADVEATVIQAYNDLVHNLGGTGRESHGLSLRDVLGIGNVIGYEPTPELLAQAHDNPPAEDNILVLAICASKTAGDLGLEVWDPKCWVLEGAYKTLLLELGKQAGIELPPPQVEEEKQVGESADSGDTAPTHGSAAPAIVWRADMKRDELYQLARELKGVTSKATKAKLVEALRAVAAPTPA